MEGLNLFCFVVSLVIAALNIKNVFTSIVHEMNGGMALIYKANENRIV
jgi:hypothetical protein